MATGSTMQLPLVGAGAATTLPSLGVPVACGLSHPSSSTAAGLDRPSSFSRHLIAAGRIAAAVACFISGSRIASRSQAKRHGLWQTLRTVAVAAENAKEVESLTAVQEVLQALRKVKDPGLDADIVTSGFVGDIKADRRTGAISLGLEVAMFKEQAEEELRKIPWAKEIDVEVRSVRASPPKAAAASRPLPETTSSLDKVKSIVAVYSCKGGVGKSTVSTNLAFALQKKGAKVGLFDCDVYGPSLPVMVKFEEQPSMEMYEDKEKKKHIKPVIHPETGIKLLSFGYAGNAAVMRGSMVTGLIAQLMTQTDWEELDYLVLDLPPGTGDIHLTLAQVCKITAAVIVTTPQQLSVIDVKRGIAMFSQLAIPSVAVVQNMSYLTMPDGSKNYVFGRTDAGKEIAETFGIEQVVELPLDPAVATAGDTGKPFVIDDAVQGAVSDELDRLADLVKQEVEDILENSKRPTLTWDETRKVLLLELADGRMLGIDPQELRLRDKAATGVTPPPPNVFPTSIGEMGNYAVVIRWSDGVDQVTPHRQLIDGDEKGPMPHVDLEKVEAKA